MIKMMVVEDEAILRKGICRVGDWEARGVEICCAVSNGAEALARLDDCKPDVVLTDVVMPVMDGIELARNLHERYPDIRIIFLSGHEEFEYVKKAMEYKACSYLLKPAKIERIVEAVTEIRSEIEQQQEQQREQERIKKKLRQSIPILREHFLNQLLNGRKMEEERIRSQFEFLEIDLEERNLAVLIGQPDVEKQDHAGEDGSNALRISLLQLAEVCEEVLQNEYRCVVFMDLKDRVVAIVNYPSDMHANEVVMYLQGKAVRIQKEMERYWGCSVSMGIGRLAENILYLQKAYKEAEDALAYRFFMGTKSVIYIGDVEQEESRDWVSVEQKEEELLACIKAGDEQGTREQIGQYFAFLGQHSGWGQSFIYEELFVFTSNLLRFLRRKEMDVETRSLLQLETLLRELQGKNAYPTLLELQSQVSVVIEHIAGKMNHDHQVRNEGIIEKAREYVKKNLSGDVSLIAVADMVYVSPNYLSFLFKESGENFKDYVVRVKMEKAGEMLEAGHYNLNQIASALGYKDGRYFSQVYKRYQEKS